MRRSGDKVEWVAGDGARKLGRTYDVRKKGDKLGPKHERKELGNGWADLRRRDDAVLNALRKAHEEACLLKRVAHPASVARNGEDAGVGEDRAGLAKVGYHRPLPPHARQRLVVEVVVPQRHATACGGPFDTSSFVFVFM